jgi:hypothetical protein
VGERLARWAAGDVAPSKDIPAERSFQAKDSDEGAEWREGRDDTEMGERTSTDELIASFGRVTTAADLANATKAMHGLDLAGDPDVEFARSEAQARIDGGAQ